jgi:IPT/TIG domain-containing protein
VVIPATAADTVAASTGWKLGAIGIGAGFLLLLWLVAIVLAPKGKRPWAPWRLAEGADGALSTSKFQWFVWLGVVLFAYVVLWTLRAQSGDYSAISDIPANVMTVLGLSAATAVAAKGITVGYLDAGKINKSDAGKINSSADGGGAQGGLFTDDSGFPELAKIQLMGFTLIAVGIFVATLVHQLMGKAVTTTLPDIDSSLLVLMGLSQGGYVGKKLVSIATPVLYAPPAPASATANQEITVNGASLGQAQAASQLLFDGQPIPVESWADGEIKFKVPAHAPGSVRLAVDVGGGRRSNDVLLNVT